MDPITHGVTGYVLVRAGLNRNMGRWGNIAGVCGALFPDADSILGVFLGTEFTIRYHRYVTNSLFLVIPFSLLFAWLFVRISKIKRFWSFFLIWMAEILVHTFMDVMTSYGTMIFSPFFNARYALDWVFIIDPVLFSMLFFPMIGLWIWRRRAPAVAKGGLILAALYIALCACCHYRALSLAKNDAGRKGIEASTIAAIPQPFSPFRWGNYLVTPGEIHEGFVDLIASQPVHVRPGDGFFRRYFSKYQPVSHLQYRRWERHDNSPWVARAMELEKVKTFLWFARFPVARYQGQVKGLHRVILFDLRFGEIQGQRPFRYIVEFDSTGQVVHSEYEARKWFSAGE
jgi:inner membrane protein